MILTKYKYFEKPDGEDPLGKVLSCLKIGLYASVPVTITDIMAHTQCKTFTHAFQRAVFWMVPLNGIAVTFPSIMFISASIRGKDDALNHAIGAIGTLPIFRAWLRLPFPLIVTVGAITTAVAYMNKGLREGMGDLYNVNKRPLAVPQYG